MEKNHEIVFSKHNEVVIEEGPIPRPKPGEVLIKTECSLISIGTELTILEGKDLPADSIWESYGKMPFKPGYNNIGTVIETGDGVSGEWQGKKVATYGNHAAYVTEMVSNVRSMPSGVKNEHAAFFTIAEIALNGVRRANIKLGETAVIYGLGLVGQIAARFCRMCGAGKVIAADISDYRLGRLPENVHMIPVNTRREDIFAVVEKAGRGRMADAAFEITGVAALIPEEIRILRPQGRFILLSSPKGKTPFDFHDLCNEPSYYIIGAHNGSHPKYETPENPWTMHRNCELFFDAILGGDIDVEPLISHKVHYSKAANIYEELIKDRTKALGVILDWN